MARTCNYPLRFLEVKKSKYRKKIPNGKKFVESIICCERDALESGYCMFHDKNFFNKERELNEEEELEEPKRIQVRNKFLEIITSNEYCDCTGFLLPSIDLSKCKITAKLNLRFATFYGKVNCEKTEFEKPIDLLQSIFNKPAIFKDATFKEKIDFAGAIFNDDVYFSSTVFKKITYFWRTKFNKIAVFRRTIFEKEADFVDASFHGNTNFLGSDFQDRTDLRAHFYGITQFRTVSFSDKLTRFNSVLGFVSFFQTEIKDNIRFGDKTGWSENAKLFDEKLLESTNDEMRKRIIYSNRYNTVFSNISKNIKCVEKYFEKIENELIQSYNENQDKWVDVDKEIHKDRAYLKRYEKNKKEFKKLKNKRKTILKILNPENSQKNQETKNKFIKKLKTYSSKISNPLQKQNIIKLDEKQNNFIESYITHLRRDLTLAGILSEYSNLRKNHEHFHMYDTGGKFFIRESEISRIYSWKGSRKKTIEGTSSIYKNGKSKSIFHALYKIIGHYGENFYLPLAYLAALIIISFGVILHGFDYKIDEKLLEYFAERIFSAIIPYLPFHPDANVWDYALKIISTPLLAVFIIGLRRKLERKK